MSNTGMNSKTIDRAIEVYEAIRDHIQEHQQSPEIRELQAATGISSTSVVEYYLHILRGWGWVTWRRRRSRTLQLTRPTERIFVVEKAASDVA